MNSPVLVSIFLNGDYFDEATLAAVPFIGVGISIQETTLDGAIVWRKLRVTDVTLCTLLSGNCSVDVYCTERE